MFSDNLKKQDGIRIKLGLKMWSTNNPHIFSQTSELFSKGVIDFLEIYTVPKSYEMSKKYFKSLNMPIVIHAAHQVHDFDISNSSIAGFNKSLLEEAIKFADELDAKYIIIHPGGKENIENSVSFLKDIQDKRMLIENLPKIDADGCRFIGCTILEMKKLLSSGKEFCFDFGHAIATACVLGIDHKKMIKQFLDLKPQLFHLCDGHANKEFDEHLPLGMGDFDLKFFKECIKMSDSNMVTLEIRKLNPNSIKDDIESVQFFNRI